MHILKKDLQQSNKAGYAEGTRKNLKIQWESYLLFCVHFNLVTLPASTKNLQLFAQFLSRTFKSTDSIKNYINGVKTMHLLLGHSVDHINSFILSLSLKGIAKLHPYCLKQAEAITPKILLAIANILNFDNQTDLVYWCLFLFAFFLLARKSNLVPTSRKDTQLKQYLLRQNVQDCKHYLIVSMNWTKTIQKGERILQIPLVRIRGSILCPVRAYRKMCKAVPAADDSPLFLLPKDKIITYSMYQSKLKECIERIGFDSNKFSTHSFRRGGATLAFRANVPADQIQLLGDWRSDAYKRYLAYSFEDKVEISKMLRKHIIDNTQFTH